MNSKCIYYVEGPCEQQLIAALKESPAKLVPGKVKVFNVVQNLIPKSQMLSLIIKNQKGSVQSFKTLTF